MDRQPKFIWDNQDIILQSVGVFTLTSAAIIFFSYKQIVPSVLSGAGDILAATLLVNNIRARRRN